MTREISDESISISVIKGLGKGSSDHHAEFFSKFLSIITEFGMITSTKKELIYLI
jgi:hypothetical protein